MVGIENGDCGAGEILPQAPHACLTGRTHVFCHAVFENVSGAVCA